ncbi:MAG: helix-turn-helix domain-containing protein [Candidatus Woesearchaeota archaeon]
MRKEESLERVMEADGRNRIIEDIFHKYLGVTIKELSQDITKKIDEPLIESIVKEERDMKKAKEIFLHHYIIRHLESHHGNVKSASKEAGVNRRTLHRMISRFNIETSFMRGRRKETAYETQIHDAIERSLNKYEEIIHPNKFDAIYNRITDITKDIANNTDSSSRMSLKDAEDTFLADFISKAIERNHGNLSRAARELGIRYETLHRKMKILKARGHFIG